MKKIGKLLTTMLVIAALLATCCISALAEGEGTTTATIPSATDTATVTIKGIQGNPTVTLYRIVKPVYTATGLNAYEAVTVGTDVTATLSNPSDPDPAELAGIHTLLKQGETTGLDSVAMTVTDGVATAQVGAGMWMAVVTNGGATIYNPIIVSANYEDQNGNPVLVGGEIAEGATFSLVGGTTIAKISTPEVTKTIDSGVGDDNSASVGDVVNFKITADKPSYPSNATNETFYVSDTMTAGLTFLQGSLKVNDTEVVNGTVTVDGKVIANVATTATGFNISFVYDNITTDPVVTYSAVINDNAVAYGEGNTNTAELFYSNNPEIGETYTDLTTPPDPDGPGVPTNGIASTEDTKTVYTYQLGFQKKDGNGDDAKALSGAQFGIYSDPACTQLIDIVTTNDQGYAVSSKVKKGIYWIKEIAAPTGYTLNTNTYSVTVDETSAKATTSTTKRTYTTTAPSTDAESVGWLLDNVFYSTNPGESAQPAYLASETITTSLTENVTTGENVTMLETPIPNTKVGELPSTGGMGTYVFVFGGIAVMALAIVLLSVSKKQKLNKN